MEQADRDESAEAIFEELAANFRERPGVTPGTGFGANPGLRLGGRIFAMTVRGALVLKLPATRAASLVASGTARPFETSPGRVMREWVTISPDHEAEWSGLMEDALQFVASGGGAHR
jgi:hypothetical protein